MDNYHKIPVTYGKLSVENESAYQTVRALFWYQDFSSMMSEKAIEEALHFYESLKEFFDAQPEDEDEEEGNAQYWADDEKLILQRTRSTPLNKEQITQLVSEAGVDKPQPKLLSTLNQKNNTLECVILDIKINKKALEDGIADVFDFIDQKKEDLADEEA